MWCKGGDHEKFVETYPEETEMPWRAVLLSPDFQPSASKVHLLLVLRWPSRCAFVQLRALLAPCSLWH